MSKLSNAFKHWYSHYYNYEGAFCLSEDATRILAIISWNQRTNELIGWCKSLIEKTANNPIFQDMLTILNTARDHTRKHCLCIYIFLRH